MKINAELINKNLNSINKRLFMLNQKVNTIKISEKINQNGFTSNTQIKIKILSLEPNSKLINDNFTLILFQAGVEEDISLKFINQVDNVNLNINNKNKYSNYNSNQSRGDNNNISNIRGGENLINVNLNNSNVIHLGIIYSNFFRKRNFEP